MEKRLLIVENTNYLFSLKIDQTEFTVGGDKEFVESYLDKWLLLFKDKIPNELMGQQEEAKPEPPPSRGKMSLPDFIKMKSPKNYNDLALTVFFYYERYEGLENVGVGFKQVADFINKLPNHPSEEEIENVLSQLMEQNFIQLMTGTEHNPKYQVTFPGEQCVKQGFLE
jgi:hypothetical protein